MITIEQFESGEIKLTDEFFEAVLKDATYYDVPYKKVVAYKGKETGALLSPDFSEILEG